MRGPEGWGPRRVGPRRVGPEGWAPKGGPRRVGGPKFGFFFFPWPATIFILSSSLGGRYVDFWWCLKRPGLSNGLLKKRPRGGLGQEGVWAKSGAGQKWSEKQKNMEKTNQKNKISLFPSPKTKNERTKKVEKIPKIKKMEKYLSSSLPDQKKSKKNKKSTTESKS